MNCRIADLITVVPTAGGMASRCWKYRLEGQHVPDITIREEKYRVQDWPGCSADGVAYMESGIQFYVHLLHHSGLMLHASAVELNGKAYLFSGDCGAGKSTHARLWQTVFGESVKVFNDDKPALRRLDGTWFAYGTPWCGKDGINLNLKVPLAGICFLRKAKHNQIRRLLPQEAIPAVVAQTLYRLYPSEMHLLLDHIDRLIREIPIFELENRPEPEAARLCYETMLCAAEEAGL